ncbi:hypothetical protein [Nocardia sp. NPDC049707]
MQFGEPDTDAEDCPVHRADHYDLGAAGQAVSGRLIGCTLLATEKPR